jgi:GldL N-terminal domain
MKLYDFKWPLIIFLLGALIQIVGAMFKIRHWPMADEMITFSSIICAAAVLFAIIKLILMKKVVK